MTNKEINIQSPGYNIQQEMGWKVNTNVQLFNTLKKDG